MQTFEQTCSISNNSFEFCLRAQYLRYRKIPKISPGAYIFLRPFLRGLFLEGLIYGGKFAFQNRLGQLVVGRKFTIFALFYFVFEGKFQVQAPWEGLYLEGLIFGILRYSTSTLWPLFYLCTFALRSGLPSFPQHYCQQVSQCRLDDPCT